MKAKKSPITQWYHRLILIDHQTTIYFLTFMLRSTGEMGEPVHGWHNIGFPVSSLIRHLDNIQSVVLVIAT